MATLVSAQKILTNYDLFSPTDELGEKQTRGTAFEFQDYAYRLAKDLNDLSHLAVYMRYAKKYPRFILEETYSAIADIDTDKKGALFMWKFKEVKKIYEEQKNQNNFNLDYVQKKTRTQRNKFADIIISRSEDIKANLFLQHLPSFNLTPISKKPKALVVGNECSMLLNFLNDISFKVSGIDISPKITKKIKKALTDKSIKLICKDFFKNTYKDNFFDLIIVQKFWQSIPLESERVLMSELLRIIAPEGKILLGVKFADTSQNNWSKATLNGEDERIFIKTNSETDLYQLLANHNLEVMQNLHAGKSNYLLLAKTAQ